MLVGWARHDVGLLRLIPSFPVMVPITAELLVLLALALVVGGRALFWVGALVTALSVGMLLEVRLGLANRIARLHPFDGAFVAQSTDGSRPAVLTLIGFLLLGGAAVLLARHGRARRALVVAGGAGASTAAVCWAILVGYASGVMNPFDALLISGLAVPTAAALLFLGLGVLQLAWHASEEAHRSAHLRWWVAIAWGAVVCYILDVVSRVVNRRDAGGIVMVSIAVLAAATATLIAVALVAAWRAHRDREALVEANLVLSEREAQLARTAQLLRGARDGSLDAFFLYEAVRGPDGAVIDFRCIDVNARGEAFITRRRDAILGRTIGDLFASDEAQAYIARCAEVLRTGETLEEEFRTTGRDNGIAARWMRHQVVPVGDGVAITARDTSEARQLEDQLRHAQKMEAVGRVASGVAHDFNNLLTVVRGITEILVDDPTLPAAHREDLRQIAGAVERGAELTSRLLVFSRKQPTVQATTDPNAIIRDVVALARRVFPEGVRITTALEESVAPIRVDRLLLEQALMNLAVNARDAISGTGLLELRTRAVTLDRPLAYPQGEVAAGVWSRIEVRDSGAGMTPEAVTHLFEPFFTTKGPGKGTGLGLSTTFSIVHQSEGHLVLVRTDATGTEFHMYLPARDTPPPAAPVPVPTAAPRGSGERVLVVDDEPQVRDVVRRILSRAGYVVAVAGSGEEATGVLHGEPEFAALVTDMVMPGISGRELATRALVVHPALRVVYISGYTEDDVIRRGRHAAGQTFVAKPFTADELLTALRGVLEG